MTSHSEGSEPRASLQDVLSAWIFFVALLGCFALGAEVIDLASQALQSNVISAGAVQPGQALAATFSGAFADLRSILVG